MNVAGKKVLLTGGAVRVGAVIARRLAEAGAAVLLHFRSNAAAAQELVSRLPRRGHRLLPPADFELPDAARQLAAAAGDFDVLVNNASAYRLTGENLEARYAAINLKAPLELISALAAQDHPGCVVNVLDQIVLNPFPPDDPYTRSRVALADATLQLARELAPRRIRVNAVAPGPMLPPRGLENSAMTRTLASLPLHRRVEPDNLAAAVLFLIANSSITGAILPVDCGQHLE